MKVKHRVLLPILLLVPLSLVRYGMGERTPVDFEDLARASLAQIEGELRLPGLRDQVEVLRDRWGIPHIYASNIDDLFFAQGFVQAQDRLWQMELWRRLGEGRVAEILGPRAVERDRRARLARFRGPWDASEYESYHPEGKRILTAFTNGVNAFIEQSRGNLPVEFKLTGIMPEPWSPETPLLRVGTANPLSGARGDLRLARSVARLGAAEANRQAQPDPWNELTVPEGLDLSIISQAVVDALGGADNAFPRPDLLPEYSDWKGAVAGLDLGVKEMSPGSNNWVVRGSMTASGRVLLANDPHRAVTTPSLRYLVHLSAPGWNSIGATEPVLPGVAIGHNGYVAWGLTIVGTDQADVFVEEVNPANRNEVRWQGQWYPLEIVVDTIQVKGEEPRVVELKYSRHGPIFYEDTVNHRAYALRSALLEPGAAGYLGALRFNNDQTTTCSDFLDALRYYKAPSENMICGDVEGNIAWQASALTPRRTAGWHGRLPVPGTGRYQWEGFRDDLPREYNPARGWIATANNNIQPPGYAPPIFFKRAGTYQRYERVAAVLADSGNFTVEDFARLQHDAYSSTAAADVALFHGWSGGDPEVERARQALADWDGVYHRESAAAAIYSFWRRVLPSQARQPGMGRAVRDSLVELALRQAVDSMRATQGTDRHQWRWGRINRSEFRHPLVSAFDLPAVERSGGAGTVAAVGASFREIIDVGDFDASVATSTPGQSGQPGSPFYGNLLPLWGREEYFPLLYSRAAVEANTSHRLILRPAR